MRQFPNRMTQVPLKMPTVNMSWTLHNVSFSRKCTNHLRELCLENANSKCLAHNKYSVIKQVNEKKVTTRLSKVKDNRFYKAGFRVRPTSAVSHSAAAERNAQRGKAIFPRTWYLLLIELCSQNFIF